MKEPRNIWGIQEYEGDGKSCPIIPANLPLHKRLILTFFRFGICPVCITMSLTYSIGRFLEKPITKIKNAYNKRLFCKAG